jgi:5-methylthioadenosine/S-adenosylhomocysteine deaminase
VTHRTLITGGTVISMDEAIGDPPVGDVLLEDDRIVAVAERVDAPDAPDRGAHGTVRWPRPSH